MRLLIASLILAMTAGLAHADATCDAKVGERKLSGAAKTSFLKRCNREAAKAACMTTATDKKLAGAAKNSFMKKCEKDAAASAASAASK
ncbi:MAG TPA: hypothetical protein VFH49_17680 [Aquabacterium sp.]|nr:hypothetical protein [Aquabacterium sp.]